MERRRRNLRRTPGEPTDQYRRRIAASGDPELDDDDFDQPRVVVTHSLRSRSAPPRPPERRPAASRAEPEAEPESEPEPPPRAEPEPEPAAELEPDPQAGAPEAEPEPDPEAEITSPPAEAEERDVSPDAAPVPNASTRLAPAEPEPVPAQDAAAPGSRFSQDGEWWWNGSTWLAAVSPDGLWRWDGTRWLLQVPSGLEPEKLVEGLDELADTRYRRRGLLLAQRADDWPVPPPLTQVVAESTEILEQRAGTERRLQGIGAPGGQRRGLLGRGGSEDEHRRLRVELGNMDAHLNPRILRIGREAPEPTFREADEVLVTARHLEASARDVTAANEALLAAQAEWQARVAAATADLEHRIAERDARIAEGEVAVREAEARRERRIADAWRHLAEVRMPGKGEHLASFGSVHLFAARIEMPNAAGPAAGARAVIGSAAELTEAEPRALEDLFLVGDSGAADLHWAETNGDAAPYLLVVTESGSALVACGENEAEARRFARQVTATAATAEAMRETRRQGLADAREAVRQAEQDHSEIEAATDHRIAIEQDPGLLQAIEKAREQLAAEREDTTEIDQAGAGLQEVLDRLGTAPDPLPTADAD